MTFATSKFGSFLPAATFAMAAEFLMGLSDSVICGHILGETGLSAVNLMQGVFEIVTFIGMMVTVGTSVLFATELGALHVRRAKGYFTLGLVTVDLNDGLTLVLRDDGEIFDITDADARVSSLRSYLVSNLMTAIPSRRNLTTTGFNRNVFRL